jgi:predicted ATPase
MPGTNLSRDEQKLLDLWQNPPKQLLRPSLRAIEVFGTPGLRGIESIRVPFRYPITAICGANGAGKSTILALAALAHHSPPNWKVHWGSTQPQRAAENGRTFYRFPDFFVQGEGDSSADGVAITWRFRHKDQEITHSTTKTKRGGWGRYETRPEREVDFLPLGRIVPAHEMTGVRTNFVQPSSDLSRTPLGADPLKALGYILGREYAAAEFQSSKRWSFQQCRTSLPYTAFNMGGGESCIIALLHLLQRLPRGGMLVVEEIDAALHSQAQVRLAEVLVQYCLKNQIQVICSTHSETFIDALPRQARLLIKRTGEGHVVYESPSTRFAVYEMLGSVQPELAIYCEDYAASVLIEEALPQSLRSRVKILDVGSKVTVIRQGVSHLRGQMPAQVLCVLDGDVSEAEIAHSIKSECSPRADVDLPTLILPGDLLPPERWVLQQLEHEPYITDFATRFSCSTADAKAHITSLRAQLDHHDIGFALQQRTGIERKDCLRRTMGAVGPQHPQMDSLRERVKNLLDHPILRRSLG